MPRASRRSVLLYTPNTQGEARLGRERTFGINVSLDGYIVDPGDDIGRSVPSDELRVVVRTGGGHGPGEPEPTGHLGVSRRLLRTRYETRRASRVSREA